MDQMPKADDGGQSSCHRCRNKDIEIEQLKTKIRILQDQVVEPNLNMSNLDQQQYKVDLKQEATSLKKAVPQKREEQETLGNVECSNGDSSLVDLKQELAASLKKSVPQKREEQKTLGNVECSNGGCSLTFSEKETFPLCVFHPGQPIFHEGLKYWSCCKKKTMEFDEFMKQKGCATGEHCWFPKKKKVNCRVDWHQTAKLVTVTIYSKGYDFNSVKIQANAVKLNVDLALNEGNFSKEWNLFGTINVEESVVLLTTTKVEINLRKAEALQWLQLEHPKENAKANNDTEGSESNEESKANDNLILDEL